MNEFKELWQFNVEFSLLLLAILLSRFIIKKTTKHYNAYLLWLSIPLSYLATKLIRSLDLFSIKQNVITEGVNVFIVTPTKNIANYTWVYSLWAFVSAILVTRLIWQHYQLRKQLKTITIDGSITKHGSLGFKIPLSEKYPVVHISQKEMAPAVYGFLKPKIYFPVEIAQQLSEKQVALIIRHEEEHIKQKHLWLNLLWDIIVAINWFNPLLYFARQQFRHDQELYCDYITLNDSDNESKKSYGHALLSTVSATHSVSLLCSWKMFNQLEERIMNLQTSSSLKSKISMLVGATTILTASALYAATEPASKSTSITTSSSSTLSRISVDGRTYVNDNGDMYMLENGQKRSMTEKEIAEYDDLMADSKRKESEYLAIYSDNGDALKEIEELTEKEHHLTKKQLRKIKKLERLNKRQQLLLEQDIEKGVTKPPYPRKFTAGDVPTPQKPPMPRIRKGIPLETVPPKYPADAVKYNIEGFAEVKFQLDESGSPSDIKILRSKPGDIFNEPTIQAIKQWRFKPDANRKYFRYKMEYRLQ